eukprot:scaffold22127_cov34-Tisochrysis_lutea.AAC.1
MGMKGEGRKWIVRVYKMLSSALRGAPFSSKGGRFLQELFKFSRAHVGDNDLPHSLNKLTGSGWPV